VGGVGTDMGSATDLAADNTPWRREAPDRALLIPALPSARTGLFGPLMPLITDKTSLQGAKDQRPARSLFCRCQGERWGGGGLVFNRAPGERWACPLSPMRAHGPPGSVLLLGPCLSAGARHFKACRRPLLASFFLICAFLPSSKLSLSDSQCKRWRFWSSQPHYFSQYLVNPNRAQTPAGAMEATPRMCRISGLPVVELCVAKKRVRSAAFVTTTTQSAHAVTRVLEMQNHA
jgi:hypothetical protein